MTRFPIRPVLALLGALALLGLAACGPTATASVQPPATATTPPTPTATATLAPAPTPTNVPAGWLVMDTPHFSLAYPSGWTPQTVPQMDGTVLYLVLPPDTQRPAMRVTVQEHVPTYLETSYCSPSASDGIPHVTMASLTMNYGLVGEEGGVRRDWYFVNAQGTGFELVADDTQMSSDIQAQDYAILATFRPDNANPWSC